MTVQRLSHKLPLAQGCSKRDVRESQEEEEEEEEEEEFPELASANHNTFINLDSSRISKGFKEPSSAHGLTKSGSATLSLTSGGTGQTGESLPLRSFSKLLKMSSSLQLRATVILAIKTLLSVLNLK